MSGLPVISGGKLIKILTNKHGFIIKAKKGSHVRLIHPDGKRKTTVPLHGELDRGTLKAILEQTEINIEEFKLDL